MLRTMEEQATAEWHFQQHNLEKAGLKAVEQFYKLTL